MATVYTYETFADFLQFEALSDTAIELGWTDVHESIDDGQTPLATEVRLDSITGVPNRARLVGEGEITISGAAGATKTINPVSEYDIPAGTVISFDANFAKGVNTAIVLNAVAKGASSITFTASNAFTGKGYFYNDVTLDPIVPVTRIYNPVYTAITDNTLLALGQTSLSEFDTITELYKLRLYGRREAWKMAMQSLAADYPYRSEVGNGGRHDVYIHCKEMFMELDLRISQLYGEAREGVFKQSQYFTPSTTVPVKVRW